MDGTELTDEQLDEFMDEYPDITYEKAVDQMYQQEGAVEADMSIQEVLDMNIIYENITEAKYKGKTVKLNKPMRGDSKKFKVYVANGKNKDGSIKVKKHNVVCLVLKRSHLQRNKERLRQERKLEVKNNLLKIQKQQK